MTFREAYTFGERELHMAGIDRMDNFSLSVGVIVFKADNVTNQRKAWS